MIQRLGKVRFVVALAAVAANATPALAGKDGTFGDVSEGSVEITASVPGRVKLTKLTDVAFTDVDPLNDALRAQDVCVWSNAAGRTYTVTATGSGASQAFTLAGDAGTVPYTVEWASTSGKSAGSALEAGTVLPDQTSLAVQQDCGGDASASLIVGIASNDLQSMTASTAYTGTLTLVVAPQ